MIIIENVKSEYIEKGRRVRTAREYAGLKREALAQAIFRDCSLIASIEQGRRNLTPQNAELIAEVCRVDPNYLLLKSEYLTVADSIKATVGQMQNNDVMWMAFIKYVALFAGYTMKDKSSMDISPSPYMVFERDGQEEHFSLRDVNNFIRELTKHSGLSFQMMIDRKKGE